MQLNDASVKEAIKQFTSEDAPEREKALSQFRREVELYIYNFPRLAYRKSPDVCSEFYLYVIDRLEKIIINYPLDAEILFQTWFNYVLKNQFINFYHYNKSKETVELSLEQAEPVAYPEVFSEEPEGLEDLRRGMDCLSRLDRVLLLLNYLPENLNYEDVRFLAQTFQLPVSRVFQIQKNLIVAYQMEAEKLREVSDRLSELNQKLVKVKYELYKNPSLEIREKSEMLLKISRLEGSRYKLIRRLDAPDRGVFLEFANLFQNSRLAQYRLTSARKKLKFEVLKLMRARKEVGK